MKITIIQIRNMKEGDILSEAGGLQVKRNKTKISFNYRRRINGKEKFSKLGEYPEMSLADARLKAQEVDSAFNNKFVLGISFKDLVSEYLAKKDNEVKNSRDIRLRFAPFIERFNTKKWSDISLQEMSNFVKEYTNHNTERLESAKRNISILKQVEIYGFNSGYLKDLKFQFLNKLITAPKTTHRPSIPPEELSSFFSKIKAIPSFSIKQSSLIFMGFYTLLRPIEYCTMQWDWIDLDKDIIKVPASVMKMKKEHIVPMSKQLKTLVTTLKQQSTSIYVFPCATDKSKHISNNALSKYLRDNGFKDVICPHGFRSVGRSWMSENSIPYEVAEQCLAHVVGTNVERAYNRVDLLEMRKNAMQKWCDYVDRCFNS